MNFMWSSLLEVFLGMSIVMLLLVGVVLASSKGKAFSTFNSVTITFILTCLVLMCLLFLLCFRWFVVNLNLYFGGFLVEDALLQFFKLISVVFTGMMLLLGWQSVREESWLTFEFFILLLFVLLSNFLLISANDFLMLYLGIELQSLTLYTLGGLARSSMLALEASLKYYILGSFSSGLLLFGISLIYIVWGSTNFAALEALSTSLGLSSWINDPLVHWIMLGFYFVLFGILFKFSAVPFHFWTPDVYAGVSLYITSIFAMLSKMGIFVLLLKLCYMVFFSFFYSFQWLLFFSGILSVMWGCLGALAQTQLKSFFAYSTMNNVGFLLIGLGIGSIDGLVATVIYFMVYMILAFMFFGCLLVMRKRISNIWVCSLTDLSGFWGTNPGLALVLALVLFSMAGVPPLMGFFGKFFLIYSLIENGLLSMAFICMLFSVVSAVYYIRIIAIMFFNINLGTRVYCLPANSIYYLLVVGSLINVSFCFFPGFSFNFCLMLVEQFWLL